MNLWGTPERYLAITDAVQRRAAESEDLVAEVADALAAAGEYVARVELRPTQRIVDLKWAVRQAGRRLGIRVDVDVTISESSRGFALIRVTAQRPLD